MFLVLINVCLIVIFAIKYYATSRSKRAKSRKCLIGKTTIVTGANSGIGYETAVEFATRGARVIMACRNLEKANDARSRIVNETANENVIVRSVDLESFDSVRRFAEEINRTEDRLDILVNNAGTSKNKRRTVDGMDVTMQTNHLSPFLLTHLLADLLKRSAPSRVVNVSSVAAMVGKLNVSNLNAYPKYSQKGIAQFLMYSNTKLCNILFTRVLAEKLKRFRVTANVLHPGIVATKIWNELPKSERSVILFFINRFWKDSIEGAQTTIELALSDKLASVTGKLYDNCEEIPFYNSAKSYKLAEEVWKQSEELVKLHDHQKLTDTNQNPL